MGRATDTRCTAGYSNMARAMSMKLRDDLQKNLIRLVVVLVVALPRYAAAHAPGVILSGTGTAVIDGTVSPGEWVGARCRVFPVNVPEGGTTTGTLCAMNDAANLYLLVQFARAFVDLGNSAGFDFDNDHDGAGELVTGDDALVFNPDIGFLDEVRTSDPPCPSGFLCGLLDTDLGGTNDGAGAFRNDLTSTVYEFSHPLRSADTAHDFSLRPGDTVGFRLLIVLSGMAGTVDTFFPTAQFGDIVISLKRVMVGTRTVFTLATAADKRWTSIEMVGGRSYCAQLAPGATAVNRATPTLSAFRADWTTVLGSGSGVNARTCFVAPATEAALLEATQSDGSARPYLLRVVESTLWANWWYVGGSYSSFTLLRNTTSSAVNVTLTWRSDAGVSVGSEQFMIPPHAVVFRDARTSTSGASAAGSVEVAHDGEPQALVGSQTTLSGATGLSFDTVLMQRVPQ